MHHLTCGISSLLHSVNLILFTVLLVYLILRISPHHSHQLRSHHLSLPQSFTPHLTHLFHKSFPPYHSYSFRTAFTDLNLYCIKGALAFVCFIFFFLATCARLSWILSFRVHVKLSSFVFVSCDRIVSYAYLFQKSFFPYIVFLAPFGLPSHVWFYKTVIIMGGHADSWAVGFSGSPLPCLLSSLYCVLF